MFHENFPFFQFQSLNSFSLRRKGKGTTSYVYTGLDTKSYTGEGHCSYWCTYKIEMKWGKNDTLTTEEGTDYIPCLSQWQTVG